MSTKQNTKSPGKETPPTCFLIMPISDQEGYPRGHFNEVRHALFDAACGSDFKTVRADDVQKSDIIHLSILRQLLDADIAICDLSGLNPNVMFELGLRQAFGKPVVLVKDSETKLPFDISGIRAITYAHTLRVTDIERARKSISDSLNETLRAHQQGELGNSLVDLLSMDAAQVKDIGQTEALELRLQLLEKNTNKTAAALTSIERSLQSMVVPSREARNAMMENDAFLSGVVTSRPFRNALADMLPTNPPDEFE